MRRHLVAAPAEIKMLPEGKRHGPRNARSAAETLSLPRLNFGTALDSENKSGT
jgi:hypothetical protein